jgi:hypothetical protein
MISAVFDSRLVRRPIIHVSLPFLTGLLLLSIAKAAPPASDAPGTYRLVMAAGQRLPAVVSENPSTGYKQEVVRGSIELRADGTFIWSTSYRETSRGTASEHESTGHGQYSVDGNTIKLTAGSSQFDGTLSQRTLTLRADVELVYDKQPSGESSGL